MQTPNHVQLWREARTRFSNELAALNSTDLAKKLPPAPNSIGFLVRHILEVELLFAKNVFGAAYIKIVAKTVIAGEDTGEWQDLAKLQELSERAFPALSGILSAQTAEDWQATVQTKEFGTKTKAEALGRITSHTAYHAGQIALLRKYGKIG